MDRATETGTSRPNRWKSSETYQDHENGPLCTYISRQTLKLRIFTLFLSNRTFTDIPGHLWRFLKAFAANSAHPSLIHTLKEKGRILRFMPTRVLKPKCGTGTQHRYSITAFETLNGPLPTFFMMDTIKKVCCKKYVNLNIRDHWDASQVLLGPC